MELPTAKRRKMSDHEANKSAQTSHMTKTKYQFIISRTKTTTAETLLIKQLFEIYHVLITAPSWFGKSLNRDMIRRFVEIEVDKRGKPIKLNVDEKKRYLKENQPASENFKLFQGKKIFKEKNIVFEHFGKYPTIHVNFRGVQANNFEEILNRL
ncbi:hypothetical protein PV325_003378 [Microctonus aethiopoides]|nr:hypothetical protein PV325_003378 [Microctonus aethiopoides]KAK0093042.1 hypothetical protein PV326_014450 [Microctonus aethiopoides]